MSSLAFRLCSFLASISLLETKLIKSAILMFADRFTKGSTILQGILVSRSAEKKEMAREMAEFSNVIADNQNDIVHILENASHFHDADRGYRHVRVRDIQQNTDVSACHVKGTRMFKCR